MKKLMVMLGAAAMAFGLFADDPALFSTSFETGDDGVSELTWTPAAPWSGLTGDLTLTTGDRTGLLPYTGSESEADPMTRRDSKFKGAAANANWLELETGSDELKLAIAEGNLALDQLVKFTGFEDPQTNLVAGTKIAVWMSEFVDEDDEDVTTTNLFVTCAKVTEDGTEQVAIQIPDEYALDTWYRLTIVSLGDIYDGASATARAGFKVFVNGKLLASDEAKSLVFDAGNMSDDAKALYAKGSLFPSIAADATFAQVAYKGIGAIDDIIVDVAGPAFRTDAALNITLAQNVILTATKDDLERTLDATGVLNLEPGTWTFSFSAKPGFVIDPAVADREVEVSVDDEIDLSNIKAGKVVATVNEEFKYASLSNALVKVQALEATQTDITIVISETVTEEIEGAGTLGFDEGTLVIVNCTDPVADWVIFGNARLGADIVADKTVIVALNEDADLAGTLEYTGEVAGSLTAATLSKLDEGTITIAVIDEISGAITVGTQIPDYATFFAVPDNYEVDEADNGDNTYTYTAVQSAPETVQFFVQSDEFKIQKYTVKTNGEEVVGVTGNYVVELGAVVTITAEPTEDYKEVTITSDDVEVQDGVFTASKAATIKIDATAKEYYETITLTQDKLELTVGGATATLEVTTDPEDPEDDELVWSSDKTDIATVVNGVVTPVAAGTAIITVASKENPTVFDTCTVTVSAGQKWPDDPSKEQGKDAKETFPNLPATFAGADAGLVAAWAKDATKGNLAYDKMADADIDAFLLDCSEADLATAKANFKIVSITSDGAGGWTIKVVDEVTGEGSTYRNGKIQLLGKTAIDAKEEWHSKIDTDTVFKAKLAPFVIGK